MNGLYTKLFIYELHATEPHSWSVSNFCDKMDCSTHFSTYTDPSWCDLPNGLTLYCNPLYPLNCICNATTEADADIAGPGVISSFIIVAWVTLLVAMVPAFFTFLEFLEWAHQQRWPGEVSLDHDKSEPIRETRRSVWIHAVLNLDKVAILRKVASRLLGSLCDLQVITGLGIVLAGLVQMPGISFYHESVVGSAWWLTLNSFFAARVDFMEDNAAKYGMRAIIRRSSVLISVILGTVFQCLTTSREQNDWDPFMSKRCYLFHDESWVWPWAGWFWVAGLALFGFCLLLSIIPWTRATIDGFIEILDHGKQMCNLLWIRSAVELRGLQLSSVQKHGGPASRSLPLIARPIAIFVFATLLMPLYWLSLQLLAVFSYGDGFYPVLMLFYIAFGIWNTFDILDVKLSNGPLIEGLETKWGFGQVLRLVLLVAIVYNAVDAFEGKRMKLSAPLRHHE